MDRQEHSGVTPAKSCPKCGTRLLPSTDGSPPFCPACALLGGLGDLSDPEPAPASETIGPYKVLGLLGEGGFAKVYHVQQETPVRREAALKVLKLGMDTDDLLARFAQEREALALLEHSAIARIYDAGATEVGRPYVVMELVRGLPITEYCDENRLTVRGRAELFCGVCRAIAHAHSKGVVHRDIKPSNVLVHEEDGQPVPKVIDFGIAHAASEAFTGHTVYTRTHQFFGTPGYVPPEQFAGAGTPDERVDVYALGALLYELLCGAPPNAAALAASLGIEEVLATLRKPVPAPADIAKEHAPALAPERGTDARGLLRALKSRISRVALRALEPKPSDRYQSVNELHDDLQQALGGTKVRIPVASQRRRRTWRAIKYTLAAAAIVPLFKFIIYVSILLGHGIYQKPASSRNADGSVSPVALFQFDGNLENSIPGAPPLTPHGNPDLKFETTEISGKPAQVLRVPAFRRHQWLSMPNDIGPNGPRFSDETNHFTIVFDFKFLPGVWTLPIYQGHTENSGEAEIYLLNTGFSVFHHVSGNGHGQIINDDSWTRAALVSSSDGNAQIFTYYLGGEQVGSLEVVGKTNSRFALDERIQFFCDGQEHTSEFLVNSLALYDVPLTAEEVHAIGGYSAAGIPASITPAAALPSPQSISPEARFPARLPLRQGQFGHALATIGDTLFAGSCVYDNDRGSIEIHRIDTSTNPISLTYEGELTSDPGLQGDQFGASLATYKNTLFLGTPGDSISGYQSGAVYTAQEQDGEWRVVDKLSAPDARPELGFGNRVTASQDGVFVATRVSSETANVYFYRHGSWESPAQILSSPIPGLHFGAWVAARDDWLAIGAIPVSESELNGKVFLYRKNSENLWNLVETLISPKDYSAFGQRIVFDDNVLAVSTNDPEQGGPNPIFIYRLEATSQTWASDPEILHTPTLKGVQAQSFGFSLHLENGLLTVGDNFAIAYGNRSGGAFVFQQNHATQKFEFTRLLLPKGSTTESHFGESIAAIRPTDSTRTWIVSGATHDSTIDPSAGSVLVFPLPRTEDVRLKIPQNSGITTDVALHDDLAAISISGFQTKENVGNAIPYHLNQKQEIWTQGTPLKIPHNGWWLYRAPQVAIAENEILLPGTPGITSFFPESKAPPFFDTESLNKDFVIDFSATRHFAAARVPGRMLYASRPLGEGPWEYLGLSYTVKRDDPRPIAAQGNEFIFPHTEAGSRLAVVRLDNKIENGWEETALISPPPNSNARWFGHSLSRQGDLLAVGTPGTHTEFGGHHPEAAATYLYQKQPDATWKLTATLRPPTPETTYGQSIALADQSTLLVAAPAQSRIYLYKKRQNIWHHQDTLEPSNPQFGDRFGHHLAADGNWAATAGNLPYVYFFKL